MRRSEPAGPGATQAGRGEPPPAIIHATGGRPPPCHGSRKLGDRTRRLRSRPVLKRVRPLPMRHPPPGHEPASDEGHPPSRRRRAPCRPKAGRHPARHPSVTPFAPVSAVEVIADDRLDDLGLLAATGGGEDREPDLTVAQRFEEGFLVAAPAVHGDTDLARGRLAGRVGRSRRLPHHNGDDPHQLLVGRGEQPGEKRAQTAIRSAAADDVRLCQGEKPRRATTATRALS